jgi:hypothetical protein
MQTDTADNLSGPGVENRLRKDNNVFRILSERVFEIAVETSITLYHNLS